MIFPTNRLSYGVSQAALNARPFWKNGLAARWGGLANVSLYGTRPRLGGESYDRIGWGRLRSFAFAERYGLHALLNVGCAVACEQYWTTFRGNHCGTHDDLRDNQVVHTLNGFTSWVYDFFSHKVSGNRIRRHLDSHVEVDRG